MAKVVKDKKGNCFFVSHVRCGVTEGTFFSLDELLEIAAPMTLGDGEALLYINYYGLKHDYCEALVARYGKQLIVDNTQAFYALPTDGIDTFYSCRKFFGVADGAYLYCDQPLNMELEQDQSWQRMDYLLKRIDVSPEVIYRRLQYDATRPLLQCEDKMAAIRDLYARRDAIYRQAADHTVNGNQPKGFVALDIMKAVGIL